MATPDTAPEPEAPLPEGAKRILFAVDESENCSNAFDWILEKMASPGDRITLIHVFEFVIPVANPRGGVFVNMDTIMSSLEEQGRQKAWGLLRDLEAKAQNRQLSIKKRVLKAASAKHALDTVVNEEKDDHDILVVASRGLGGVKRFILGSVSDHLLHHSPIPIMVVHPQDTAPAASS